MRKVFVVLLSLLSIAVRAADYYVSSSGSDSANGLSSSTPWQTISKVNSAFSSINPGDRILFRRGDRFYGALQISRSGASGNPITISAYGTGAIPVITGFTTITGWTNYGGGVYSKALTCQSRPNMVTVNGVNTPVGRWPNTGYLSIDSHSSNTSMTDSELTASPDWTGAEVVIRKNAYIWDRNRITDHSGTTLYYTSGSYYNAIDGYGYFIQNSIKTLDRPGEWCYEGSTFYMYFGSAGPGSSDVKVSTIDQLASLLDKNYITFDNVSFEGANLYAIQINNSDYISVQNCSINFTGGNAIHGPWNGTSPYCKITNNKISNSNNNAIKLMGDHSNATLTNNTITKTGLIIGMGASGDGAYNALDAYGPGSLVQYNVIEETGYIGIHFSGDNTIVTNNFVNRYNLVKNDGGGIYTYVGTGTPRSGQKVTNNVILNGVGYGEGEPGNPFNAHGIYMDDRVRNVAVTSNTVAHCSSSGIHIHNAHEIEISKNTLFDNGSGSKDFGAQIIYIHDTYSADDPIRNLNVNNNIFFAKTVDQKIMSFSTITNDISSMGSSDYNCYAKPLDNTYIARTWLNGWNSTATYRSLSDWRSLSGKDGNSFISPISLTDVNRIRFEYNSTNSNKAIALNGNYIDVKGTKYSGTLTLPPFSSVVLMVDPNASTPPPPAAIPVYVSSVIENATPARLELTYNLSLAGTVPATSAFTVTVNSTNRTVSAVAVSGTKVILTLSSPVVYGNTVTVGYTKPSTSPLQTSAGGQAVTISAQPVTNKVAAVVTTPPPAPLPAYVSSAVANAAPTKLDITFSLNLASISPSPSAFSVRVNSTSVPLSSVVAISGTKVTLTLTSSIKNGDIVTVAYTKPSANPLQSAAGGQVASFTARSVTNNVAAVVVTPPVVTPPPVTPPAAVNTPPVAVVNFTKNSYSGFVHELNASGSYDVNRDNLTYTWSAPAGVSVSATRGSVIKYLSPVVNEPKTIVFTLNISDGKTTQTKSVPVEVLPYQPDLEVAKIIDIEASGYQSPDYPHNIIDGDIGTIWSANGDNQWIIMELSEPFSIQHIKLAFKSGLNRESYFEVFGSEDRLTWEPVLTKSASCAFSGDPQVFELPPAKSDKKYKYVKLVGLCNSGDSWNYISELTIFGFGHRLPTSYEQQPVKIFPNPASTFINVRIDETTMVPDFIRIVSLSGKIVFEDIVSPDLKEFIIPINLIRGIYIVQIGTGNLTLCTQKLIVNN
jgi:uncharacterized repeat protein (TIGR02059 family)